MNDSEIRERGAQLAKGQEARTRAIVQEMLRDYLKTGPPAGTYASFQWDGRRIVGAGAGGSGATSTYVYLNSSTSVTTGSTGLTPAWDMELYDDLACHSLLSNQDRLTIGTTGLYLIIGQADWAANATGRRQCDIVKVVAGTPAIIASSRISAANAGATIHGASVVEKLNAAEYIRMDTAQTSGGNLSLAGGNGFTFLTLTKIG